MIFLYRFSVRINHHNCNCEVSGSYMLQLASAALSIPNSPSLQLPKFLFPGGLEAVGAVVPAGCPSSLVSTPIYCSTVAPS